MPTSIAPGAADEDEALRVTLANDPQTSGGLLMVVTPDVAEKTVASLVNGDLSPTY